MNTNVPYWWEDPNPERALANYLTSQDNIYDRWKSWSVLQLIPRMSQPRSNALDYGCGGGEFTVRLATQGWKVVSGDESECSLAACRLHVEQNRISHRVQFVHTVQPDYWAYFENQHFELILAKDVIEHIQDDISFLREVKSHLAPKGTAVLVTQNNHSWNYLLEAPTMLAKDPTWCGWNPTHLRFYNLPSLKGKLLHVGLKPIRWRAAYVIPYRAWKSGIVLRRIRWLARHTIGTGVFHLPEILLGGICPINSWGWSIAVRCVHSNA